MVWINTDIRYIGHYVELPNTQILKKYLIGITLSVQISPKLFDQKYVNLYEFQVLSGFFIDWDTVTKVLSESNIVTRERYT